MSEILQNLFKGSGDSGLTARNNVEILRKQFLEEEVPKTPKTTRIGFGSTTFSAVEADLEVTRKDVDSEMDSSVVGLVGVCEARHLQKRLFFLPRGLFRFTNGRIVLNFLIPFSLQSDGATNL